MVWRKKYWDRCERCHMLTALCLCPVIPQIITRTKLVLVIHHRETRRTTNTGRLAALTLQNSEVLIRGNVDQPLSPKSLICEDRQHLLLYPHEKSQELTKEYLAQFKKPITLVVPDGNWRQARKIGRREPALVEIPWVKLPSGKPSEYLLRHEPMEEGLATIEAIARAFGIIESEESETALYDIFKIMVERTLKSRPLGRLAEEAPLS